MSWLEKRKKYRLRDKMDGKIFTVERDLGTWQIPAEDAQTAYEKAVRYGFVPDRKSKKNMVAVRAFLQAKEKGTDPKSAAQAVPIEVMCDVYLKNHGPSLKGGFSLHYHSNYYKLMCRLNKIKRAWAGKQSDGITTLDVRDFLATFRTVGSRMKYLRTITNMFKLIPLWNLEEGILDPKIKTPTFNPGPKWRAQMQPGEKRELPDTRVLSVEEWDHFKKHLKLRTFQICEMALNRFLRQADIKALCDKNDHTDVLQGIQQKTGDRYKVPKLSRHPMSYDFTNFRTDFAEAQVKAGMWYPTNHPLHFTFRSLRRTGATWAWRETRDLVSIQKMLGHRSIETTRLYLGIDESDILKIAGVMDRLSGRNRDVRSTRFGSAGGDKTGKSKRGVYKVHPLGKD